MDKRGQSEIWQLSMIFEVIIALLIAVFLIGSALSYGTVTGFNREYVKEDLKLLVSSVRSAPGDVRVAYPISKDYQVELGDEIKVKYEMTLGGLTGGSSLILESSDDANGFKMSREGTK